MRWICCMMVMCMSMFLGCSLVFAVDPAPRITDREIIEGLARLEAGQKALEQRMDSLDKRIDTIDKSLNQRMDSLDKRIDGLERSVNQRIDGLQNLIYVLISAIFAQTIGLVGFVLWDRRTTLAPVARKTAELTEELRELRQKARELERKLERIERAHAAA